MLAGHWGAALLIAAASSRSSLPHLFLLSQIQDIASNIAGPILHVEISTRATIPPNPVVPHINLVSLPYSHSLFSTLLIYAPFAYATAGTHGALAALSHCFLDALVHYPALMDPCWPFYSGCRRLSLGLWRFKWPSLLLESVIVVCGAAAYARTISASPSARPRENLDAARKRVAFMALGMVAVTLAMPYAGPPPTLEWPLGVAFLAAYWGMAAVSARIERMWKMESRRGA